MRYFTVLDSQSVILLLFLGLIVFVILFVAFGVYRGKWREKKTHQDLEAYPEDIQVGHRGVPSILILIIVGFITWALGYWIVIGLLRGPF